MSELVKHIDFDIDIASAPLENLTFPIWQTTEWPSFFELGDSKSGLMCSKVSLTHFFCVRMKIILIWNKLVIRSMFSYFMVCRK